MFMLFLQRVIIFIPCLRPGIPHAIFEDDIVLATSRAELHAWLDAPVQRTVRVGRTSTGRWKLANLSFPRAQFDMVPLGSCGTYTFACAHAMWFTPPGAAALLALRRPRCEIGRSEHSSRAGAAAAAAVASSRQREAHASTQASNQSADATSRRPSPYACPPTARLCGSAEGFATLPTSLQRGRLELLKPGEWEAAADSRKAAPIIDVNWYIDLGWNRLSRSPAPIWYPHLRAAKACSTLCAPNRTLVPHCWDNEAWLVVANRECADDELERRECSREALRCVDWQDLNDYRARGFPVHQRSKNPKLRPPRYWGYGHFLQDRWGVQPYIHTPNNRIV